ncbi:lysylphosphatidylglycerol synthase transmembrane domain-containing protein, partial [Streptomyces puniciscabiei]
MNSRSATPSGTGHARVHDGGPADACGYGVGTMHARVAAAGTAQTARGAGTGLLERQPPLPEPPQPSAPRRPRFRALRTHFGTVAGAVILGALLWRLGTGVLVDGLRRIDTATVLAALGIGVLTTVLSAWRWQLVARGLRIRLPLGPAVADYYRALFLNAALPGGILGDVHRAVRHGQSTGDMRRGVKAVVLERVAGQLALAVLAVAVLPTLPSPVRTEARDFAPLVALAGAGALAVGLAVRMNRTTSRRAGGLRAALGEARQGLFSRRGGPGIALSSAVVLAGHVAMFVVAARVAGSAASVVVLVPLAVLALVAMGLPLNVGGFGPREGVTAWAFGAAGLGASTGVAVAVVYGVLSFVASLPGAVVLIARWYAALRTTTVPQGTDQPAPAFADDPARGQDTAPGQDTAHSPTRTHGPAHGQDDTAPAPDTAPAHAPAPGRDPA